MKTAFQEKSEKCFSLPLDWSKEWLGKFAENLKSHNYRKIFIPENITEGQKRYHLFDKMPQMDRVYCYNIMLKSHISWKWKDNANYCDMNLYQSECKIHLSSVCLWFAFCNTHNPCDIYFNHFSGYLNLPDMFSNFSESGKEVVHHRTKCLVLVKLICVNLCQTVECLPDTDVC